MSLGAIWAALSSRAVQWGAAVLAGLLVVWRVVAGVKAAQRAQDQADAARAEQDARARGDAAAAAAEREGARSRLRDGRF